MIQVVKKNYSKTQWPERQVPCDLRKCYFFTREVASHFFLAPINPNTSNQHLKLLLKGNIKNEIAMIVQTSSVMFI